MKLVAIQDECMSSGKGTAGTHFQHYFDDFVMTPEEMSPKASIFFFFQELFWKESTESEQIISKTFRVSRVWHLNMIPPLK